MIRGILLSSIFALLLTTCEDQKMDHPDPLLLGFLNPPVEARPKGYWCFVNGNTDLSHMTWELKEYKEKGIGTLDIWDVAGWVDPDGVVPAGPSFMSDESVQAIAHAVREAGKIGLQIGLTISSSWNAGGDWVKPEDGVMGLFNTTLDIQGPSTVKLDVPFPEIPKNYGSHELLLEIDENGLPSFYKDVAILAYQVRSDSIVLSVENISETFNGTTLDWEVPAGNWRISRYVCTGTGQPLMVPSPNSNGLMIDHFSAEAMENHLNFFFEKLETELGDLSQTALKYLYTDSYEANTAVWTVKMPEEFHKRTGYSLVPYLPILNGMIIENDDISERFLFDFKKVLSDLIIENHYVLGQKLCAERGLDFIAEAGGPGPPIHNVPFESLSSLGKLSVPRGEFWFDPLWSQERIDQLQIVKGPASAAHMYNLPRVEAEAFTGTQIWQFGPGDLKSTADRAMCEGLTSFVYHTSPHIPREAGIPGWVYNFGTIINTTRVWWPLSAGFHHYLARSSFLLQQGHFVADVLYYYGDYAPNFVEPKHIDPALGFGYDYDVCNTDIILNRLDVRDGYFILPHGQKYKVLVLPSDDKMDPDVLEKIAQLVHKGGIIIGPKPNRAYSLSDFEKNDLRIREIAEQLWKSGESRSEYGKGLVFPDLNDLKQIMEGDLDLIPDVKVQTDTSHHALDFIHRQSEGADIYFFRNTTAAKRSYILTLRSTKGSPELWDPEKGTICAIPVFEQTDRITSVPITLPAYGSVFILFRPENPGKHIVEVRKDQTRRFPSSDRMLAISYSGKGMIFEESGMYELIYSDGSSESRIIGEPSKNKISGLWEIRFPHGWGTPGRVTVDSLVSWTHDKENNIQYFSGIGIYYKEFNWSHEAPQNDARTILDLGSVSKVARVYLNGRDLGTDWVSPYNFDVTEELKMGTNYLIVEVANVMSNQMTGDAHRSGTEKRTHSNITRGPNAWMIPYKDLPLIESGLMGPVTLTTNKLSIK